MLGDIIIMYFIGNKKDLEDQREVPFVHAKEFASHNCMLDAIETSAKENTNVDTAFLQLAKVCSIFFCQLTFRDVLSCLVQSDKKYNSFILVLKGCLCANYCYKQTIEFSQNTKKAN